MKYWRKCQPISILTSTISKEERIEPTLNSLSFIIDQEVETLSLSPLRCLSEGEEITITIVASILSFLAPKAIQAWSTKECTRFMLQSEWGLISKFLWARARKHIFEGKAWVSYL